MAAIPYLANSTPTVRPAASVTGPLRAGRRTKELLTRLRPGEVAVIDHADLDPTAARALVEARVAAVLNAAASITGRYPNGGPAVLLEAAIPLLDRLGAEFFEAALASDGVQVAIDGDRVTSATGLCGQGIRLTPEAVAKQIAAARSNLGVELDAFARNTLRFLSEEKSILLDPVDLPEIATDFRGRHAMVVVRGEGYKEDLRMLLRYYEDVRPVLVGVDGGADALLEEGLRPDIIIGDMDSVSDAALRSGAELVVHGYATGDRAAPGMDRIGRLGLKAQVFHAPGTSEDIAILLADEKGASLVVAVGTHFSLLEFLDKGRAGMASTFLVRLRTGSKLVDAKGIGRLWDTAHRRNRPATVEIALLVVAALFPIGVIAVISPWFRTVMSAVRLWLRSTLHIH